ncbi:MAG: SpoIID/LytB domain-containing protein, partial [bacterium]
DPNLRVLLAANPATFTVTSENPFKVTWFTGGFNLDFSAQEVITTRTVTGNYWILLEQIDFPTAILKITNSSSFFSNTGKPLIGEAFGASYLLLGPYPSWDQAGSMLASVQENFPQARIQALPLALKMETSRTYDLFWTGDSQGDIIKFEGNGLLKVNSRRYRGYIDLYLRIRNSERELLLLNELDLESYLYGVVPAEMPFDWPPEALKAQAVASRTYALKKLQEAKLDNLTFDVDATVSDQVYRGFEAEKESTNQAVDYTRGEVLTYQGELITAAFHSCSGGYTENNENVWKGIPVPYLRGVPSPGEEGSKYFQWTRTVTVNSMCQKIEELKGISLGKIINLETLERGVSGRIKTLMVYGITGSCTISGEELRRVADLPSALVSWESNSELRLFVLSSSDVQEIGLDQAMALSSSGIQQLPQKFCILSSSGLEEEELSPDIGEYLVFSGKGWGHGVGMSQWGARARAEEGKSYQEILAYYYQGVHLEKKY